MKPRFWLIGIFALVLAATTFADDKSDSLAIIVAKDSKLDQITMPELVRIFRGEKSHAPDGTKFQLTMREPASDERAAILKDIYKMSDVEYKKYFLQATFTGMVQSAPKQISTMEALRSFVASTPGAIGYVRASDLDDNVKAIKVDGKSPTDADYSLKIGK
jgi:ABC-type phosphate transport system substrate-binding protein